MGAASPQKWDGYGEPSLPWIFDGRFRAVGSEWPELRGSRVKNKPVRIGSVTGFFVSLWKYQAATVASAGFAALRRFRKTYPPMPPRRRSEAATWPGSGTAAAEAEADVTPMFQTLNNSGAVTFHEMLVKVPVNWIVPAPSKPLRVLPEADSEYGIEGY